MYTQIALSTIVCASVFTAISTVAVAMHIYSRICLRLSYKVGEWIVLTAYLASLLLVAQTIWCVVSESRDESLSQVHSQFYFLAKSLLANQILWALVNTLVKISALYFKLQILGVARKIWIAAWTLISLSIAYAVATITSLGMCSPIQAAWDPAVSGTCRDQNVAYVWIEFAGAVLDILILILPLQMLINLKISRKKKIAISLLLSAGGVVTVVTVLRIAALAQIKGHEFTYHQGYLGLLTVLGSFLGIISCCTVGISIVLRRMVSSGTCFSPGKESCPDRSNKSSAPLKAPRDLESKLSSWSSAESTPVDYNVRYDSWPAEDRSLAAVMWDFPILCLNGIEISDFEEILSNDEDDVKSIDDTWQKVLCPGVKGMEIVILSIHIE